MNHKTMIVVADSAITEEVNNTYNTEIESIATLFFEGDFINDRYKPLWIDEDRGYCHEDKDNFKLRNLVRQCFPNTERILVDVSW